MQGAMPNNNVIIDKRYRRGDGATAARLFPAQGLNLYVNCIRSPHWGLNPGPSVYKTDALPLSYRGRRS